MLGGMWRLAVLTLLAPAALLGVAPTAHAAAPTCQGQAATEVGTPGGDATGSDGDDVIVTNGATTINAGDGDDLICVTGTAAPAVVTVDAGAGSDTVLTGRQGQPMNHVIDLGEGDDSLILKGLPGTGSVDGGAGRDSVQVHEKTRVGWLIDNRKQLVKAGKTTMPVAGLEEYHLSSLRWRFLRFKGGPEREHLDLVKFTQTKPDGGALVAMGGGRDRLTLGPGLSGIYHGGADEDRLIILGDPRPDPVSASISVDMVRDLVSVGAGDDSKATAWNHVQLKDFARNLIWAGGGPNQVVVRGCRATIYGGSGGDEIRFDSSKTSCGGPLASRSVTAYGEGGTDTLTGSIGNDLLVGGSGRDTAKGGPGRDTCSAEVRVSC
jgi:Ca2+-binding RTX toxin-like protein